MIELKLDKLQSEDIDKISVSSDQNIIAYTGKGVSKKVLASFEKLLAENENIIVGINIDLEIESTDETIRNLDVIEYIPSVKNLEIYAHSDLPLNELSADLNNISLKSFRLIGLYKDSISLEPVRNSSHLEDFELENGLKRPHYSIVNSFSDLKRFRIQNLDLSLINEKLKLEKLWVNHTLKNHQPLSGLFPNLKEITLVRCSGITDFDFLDELSKLEIIKLWYMPQLEKFPLLNSIKDNIKTVSLISVKNFSDIENLLNYPNLQKLAITDISKIDPQEFVKFKELKKLTHLYTRFKNPKDNQIFEEICRTNNWINTNF